MDKTTQEPLNAEQIGAIDPEHDIDAKKTIMWLGASLVFVVICLLVLAKAFEYSVRGQQHEVIEELPAEELRQLRSDEDYAFKKMPPAGEADTRSLADIEKSIKKTTDSVISEYLK